MRSNKFVKIISLLSICLLLCGCSFGARKENNKKAPVAEEVDEVYFSTVDVAKGEVDVIFQTGVSYKKSSVESLFFDVNKAKISKSYVEIGDYVKKGDLLIECEATEINSEIEKLNAQIIDYKANVEYYTNLVDIESRRKYLYNSYGKEYNSDLFNDYNKSLDDYTKNLNVAEKQLNEYTKLLESCKIYATKDGQIGYVATTNKYTTLNKGETAVTILDDRSYFYTNIETENIGLFKVGEDYDVTVKKGKNKKQNKNEEENSEPETYNIVVRCSSIDIKSEDSATYAVTFDSVTDSAFLDVLGGFSCKLNIITESVKDVLYVPKDTIINTANGYCVYVQALNGNRELKDVEIGLFGTDFVEIKSGLTLGEQILSNKKEN